MINSQDVLQKASPLEEMQASVQKLLEEIHYNAKKNRIDAEKRVSELHQITQTPDWEQSPRDVRSQVFRDRADADCALSKAMDLQEDARQAITQFSAYAKLAGELVKRP